MSDYMPVLIFFGMVFGAAAGGVLAGLMCAASDPVAAARNEIIDAYLQGYQDSADGLAASPPLPWIA